MDVLPTSCHQLFTTKQGVHLATALLTGSRSHDCTFISVLHLPLCCRSTVAIGASLTVEGIRTSFSVLPELRCNGPFGRETALKHGFCISPSLLLLPSSPTPSQSPESTTPVNGVASFLSLQRHRGPQAARPCPAWHSG